MEDKKFNVGIVGYWYATNYGSVATYYALDLAIRNLGYSTILIDAPEKERDPEGEDVFSRNFLKKHCNISDSLRWDDIEMLNDICDNFVIGSDQVWTPGAIRHMKYMFFLSFASDDKRKIAYAPSFGNNQFAIGGDELVNVNKYINEFDAISVRESVGKKILSDMFNCNADQVLDPVFLIEPKEYVNVAKESKIKTDKKFLLAYILDPTDDKLFSVKMMAEQLNLTPKIILDGRKNTFKANKDKCNIYKEYILENVNEADWVKYLYDAPYIFTDSHHGLAMAIIFEKPFVCYANHSRGYARFVSLLSQFNLMDKMIQNKDEIDNVILDEKIDYASVNAILSEKKDESIEWLKSALSTKKRKNSIACHLNLTKKCTGCSACEAICPTNAIRLGKNSNGFINPKVNNKICTDCGLCTQKCIAINTNYSNTKDPKCWAVMASDEVREVSSSGGAFTLFAEAILNKGGYVCGAAFDENFNVKHIIISDKKDLDLLRGSKYYQSNLDGIFSNIEELLIDGKYVLFTGMPCQVAGLYSYLGRKYDNIFTIDILCHGISSSKVFKKYHKDVLGGKNIVDLKFKAKKPWGWHAGINSVFDDGTKYSVIIEKDPYYIAYIQGLSKNTPCGECLYNRLPRQGDLTIGDFWKIEAFDKCLNDNKGTSVVLVNNEKGTSLFDEIDVTGVVKKEVPITYAVAGNGIICYPYKLHEKRDEFFNNLDSTNFSDLVNQYSNGFVELSSMEFENLTDEEQELYCLARIVAKNRKNRKVLLFGDSPIIRQILNKYFKISVDFVLTVYPQNVNGTSIRNFESIKGKKSEYYVLVFGRPYDQSYFMKFEEFGYQDIKDFVYRIPKPIVLENYDLTKGAYSDVYGNSIIGKGLKIKKVIFRGSNNKINLGDNIAGSQNSLIIDLAASARVTIGKNCKFTVSDTEIKIERYNGGGSVKIGDGCVFMNSKIRIYTNKFKTSVLINDNCTFGENLAIHANSGKKIVIGKDCMFSHFVTIFAGDGHSILDIKTAKNINSIQRNSTDPSNLTVLGEHVWVGYRSILLQGTNVGEGSIIGAQSVVKGIFPNNCTIAGSPTKQIRSDIAWSREMCVDSLDTCKGYDKLTSNAKPSISGQNVLVIGGTGLIGIELVHHLLCLGNNVTIANRGKSSDAFGPRVNRLQLDVSNAEVAQKALKNKYFDVVFHNVAYYTNHLENVLEFVKCGRFIEISTVEVYGNRHLDLKEMEVNSYKLPISSNPNEGDYGTRKKQIECLMFQRYAHLSPVAVRIPYVTKTERLYYFCERIAKGDPINVGNINRGLTFVRNTEIAKFLSWISAQNFSGPINLASSGMVTLKMIIEYIEKKLGKKAIYMNEKDSLQEPLLFPGDTFSMNMEKSISLGYNASELYSWFWKMMDEYIERARKEFTIVK